MRCRRKAGVGERVLVVGDERRDCVDRRGDGLVNEQQGNRGTGQTGESPHGTDSLFLDHVNPPWT
jgi:hypothetical protein